MNKFHFGKNWQQFLNKYFSEEALDFSKRRLAEFLGLESLSNKTFADFGCGSGIHSLAALELGASGVVSIDVDKDSILCTKNLQATSSQKQKWQVREGSLLDKNFIKSLGLFDIVYCWGVAHHTGDMWQALNNISGNVKQNGLLFVAIYNNVEGKLGSKMWWQIKHSYNQSPFIIKKLMECLYIFGSFIKLILHFKNPFSVIRSYKNKRGMAWTTDMIDWLGGYPYEYASVKQIFDFYKERGFDLVNIKTTNYIGCNQFLFLKK